MWCYCWRRGVTCDNGDRRDVCREEEEHNVVEN